MKCTVCGMEVNKLDYGRLKMKSQTNIKVLDEIVKNKQITLDLKLCEKCRDELQALIVNKLMDHKAGHMLEDHDLDAVRYALENDGGCMEQRCVECDGCR